MHTTPPSPALTLDAQFGALREALQQTPSAEGWIAACQACTLAWFADPARFVEVWLPYAQAALSRWPDTLRVAPPWWIARLLAREHVAPMALVRTLVLNARPDAETHRTLQRHPEHHEHLGALLALGPTRRPDDAQAAGPLDALTDAGDALPYPLKHQAVGLWRALERSAPIAHPLILHDVALEPIERLRARGHLHPEDWPRVCQTLAITEATGHLDDATIDAIAAQLDRHVPPSARPTPARWIGAMRDGLPAPRALALCGTLTIDHLPPDEAERLVLALHAAKPPLRRLDLPLVHDAHGASSTPAEHLAIALTIHDLGADWLPTVDALTLRVDRLSGPPYEPDVAQRLEHLRAILGALDRPLDTLCFAPDRPDRFLLLDYTLLELHLPRPPAHPTAHVKYTRCILEARELYEAHRRGERKVLLPPEHTPTVHHQGATIEDWVHCDNPRDTNHYGTDWLHNILRPASPAEIANHSTTATLAACTGSTFEARTITLDGPCLVSADRFHEAPLSGGHLNNTQGVLFFNGAEEHFSYYENWE